jgi:hypothetical protein
MGGGGMDGGEAPGGHKRTKSASNRGICLEYYVGFLGV